MAAPIRAREHSITFEELHDLLVGHERYLRRLETASQTMVASANFTQGRPKRNNKNRKQPKSTTKIQV